ncbi:hypothetical protein RB653_001973 [Dictyostelium firmibasis]|uniref:Uncharacterized protein n=1 Tax=Dictyostelium firmibasis TaxID=79012 RepID=A0AAN7YPM5_9MYCE
MSISWEAYNLAQGRPADWRPNQATTPVQPVQPVQQPTYQPQQPTYQPQAQPVYNQFGQPVYGQQPQPNYNQQAWGSSNVTPTITQRSYPSTQPSQAEIDALSASTGAGIVSGQLNFDGVTGEMKNDVRCIVTSHTNPYDCAITFMVPYDEEPKELTYYVHNNDRSKIYKSSVKIGTIRNRNLFFGRDSQDAKVKWEQITVPQSINQQFSPYTLDTKIEIELYRIPTGTMVLGNVVPYSEPTALVGRMLNISFNQLQGKNLIIQWSSQNKSFFNGGNYTNMATLLAQGGYENPGFR